jgi:hypothetical protein
MLDNISKAIDYVMGLKLSLSQWLLILLATLVGSLVGLLKLQGSRLHAAQVALLKVHYEGVQKDDDEAIETAKLRYIQAMKSYTRGK